MRRLLVVLSVAATLLVAPQVAAASARAIQFGDCGLGDGFQCGRLAVPTDWANPASSQIQLFVERRAGAVQPARSALIALAGGPGQSATPFADPFAQALAAALPTHDLVVYDQRGTGRSGFLTCPQAEHSATTIAAFASQCASELGPTRVNYSTRDTVDDIEALRQALGVDKVSIFGVSYGTYVAQLYARRYPAHTESLILDSVVPPTGVDPFDRTEYRSMREELRTLCAGSRCRGITKDALADATEIAKRASTTGVPFTLVDPSSGHPLQLRMGSSIFYQLFVEGLPFDEVTRARLPAALVSALHGDGAPLGQVISSLIGPTASDADPTSMSDALNLATFCSDTTFPWASVDPLQTRQAKALAVLRGFSPSDFLPFPREAILTTGVFNECLGWPSADPVQVPGPAPDVPVLVLSGRDDTLTPYEDALTTAKQFPRATVVRVPNTGHSVVTTAPGEAGVCVQAALASFLAGTPVAACAVSAPDVLPTRVDPAALAALPATGAKGLPGKTATAALRTVQDTLLTIFSRETLTGLRGGLIRGTTSEYTLSNVVFVPGVVVNGTVDWESGTAQLRIGGKGAHGTLSVVRGVGVSGRLGGKAIQAGAASVRFGTRLAAAPSARGLTLATLRTPSLALLG
jgi:pimeloyl-ACP methyl ester carboxylesterase